MVLERLGVRADAFAGVEYLLDPAVLVRLDDPLVEVRRLHQLAVDSDQAGMAVSPKVRPKRPRRPLTLAVGRRVPRSFYSTTIFQCPQRESTQS